MGETDAYILACRVVRGKDKTLDTPFLKTWNKALKEGYSRYSFSSEPGKEYYFEITYIPDTKL